MHRLVQSNSWYGWSSLTGDWAALDFSGFIKSSIDRIELDKGNPLYLVGNRYRGKFLMGGQSQNGFGTIFYTDGQWFQLDARSFGVSPCAFSQDGRYFYGVVDDFTAIVRDNETGLLSFISAPFFVDGIRGVTHNNQILYGNTTKYSPKYDLYEYIELVPDVLAVGQGNNGLVIWYLGKRYLVEPGGCFFIRAMFDGFNLALATVKQAEHEEVNWFLNTVELTTQFPLADIDPIVKIGRRMWNGWFEFQEPNPLPTNIANCAMRVKQAGSIRALESGSFIYQWIQGDSVESIEEQCLNNLAPCVAYWDARTWPRLPKLKPNDLLGIQMYCMASENPVDFELNMRFILNSVKENYNLCGIAQCFTSNAGLTNNLRALVPVYARLAKGFPKLKMYLTFSDQGRPTGLNDHPELIPYWEELFAGITGEPMADNGIVDGICVDPKKYFFSLVEGKNPADYQFVMRAVEEDLYRYGIGQQCGTNCNPRGGLYLPTAICKNAAPLPAEVCLGVHQNPNCYEPMGRKIYIVNDPPTEWIWNDQGGPEYVPYVNEVPSNMNILLFSHDTVVRRADPLGCLIKYEVESNRPVTRVEFHTNSGELPKIITFPVLPESDGRYFRAVAFKLTIEGTWNLSVRAFNDNGDEAAITSPDAIHVIP